MALSERKMDAELRPIIEQAVASHRAEIAATPNRPRIYDYLQFAHLPPRACNQSNVARWNESEAAEDHKLSRKTESLKSAHERRDWAKYAQQAAVQTIKAFDMLKIPIILAAGFVVTYFA